MTNILKNEDVQAYKTQGFVLPTMPLFEENQFQRLRALFETVLNDKDYQDLDVPHFEYPELLDFLMDDRVLDIVEDIVGPDFGLWSSHFIAKPPFQGERTPWHEDSAYWNGRFDQSEGVVTVWLAIDPATRANGCMKVIPGSHLAPESDYETLPDTEAAIFRTEIVSMDESNAVYFEREPNQFSLHDARIQHGADANTSPTRRCGYTMRYFSQSLKFNPDHPRNRAHQLWHCRGKNPHANPVQN